MLDKKLVQKHFGKYCAEYEQYADVQRKMAEHLVRQVRKHCGRSPLRRILEIGCGTGRLTRQIVREWPHTAVTALDISGEMIAEAQKNVSRNVADSERQSCIDFVQADAEEWVRTSSDDASYDLIIANAAFQWFNDPQETARRLVDRLNPEGLLAFSTFGPLTFRELHESFHKAEEALGLPHVRHGQTFLALEEWTRCLDSLADAVEVEEYREAEYYASVRDFLWRIKKIGAGNALQREPSGGFAGKRLFRAMETMYRTRYGTDRGIPATYHLCYGIYKRTDHDDIHGEGSGTDGGR